MTRTESHDLTGNSQKYFFLINTFVYRNILPHNRCDQVNVLCSGNKAQI